MTIDLDELEVWAKSHGDVTLNEAEALEVFALARKGQAYDELEAAYDKQGDRQRWGAACAAEFQKRAEVYERALREIEAINGHPCFRIAREARQRATIDAPAASSEAQAGRSLVKGGRRG